jgi:F-type H+-transporting ATPase subunit gamma
MPSLRQYRDRIGSVKNTRKITSAMKMVAASKLKRAQGAAEAAQPYAHAFADMMRNVAAGIPAGATVSPLLSGTGRDQTVLLVALSSDRGLCGGFNANLMRAVRTEIRGLEAAGKTVKILCVGRKSRDSLKRDYADKIIDAVMGVGQRRPSAQAEGPGQVAGDPRAKPEGPGSVVTFDEARRVADTVLNGFDHGQYDRVVLMFNEFKSVLTQKPTAVQLIPFASGGPSGLTRGPLAANDKGPSASAEGLARAPYVYEPSEEKILADLLPRNVAVQIFRAMLDSAAGEQAARMTAMDNSTRNAGDMIKRLSITYNRARQAAITKELIEIISGAEAV